MGLVSFGRRHRRPSAKLLKLARKYHIKVSTRKGGRRVYKSVAMLKKQIRAKMNRVRRGRAHVKASGACGGLRKRVCQSNPNCKYIRGTGCRVRGGKLREGPALPPGHTFTSFGARSFKQFANRLRSDAFSINNIDMLSRLATVQSISDTYYNLKNFYNTKLSKQERDNVRDKFIDAKKLFRIIENYNPSELTLSVLKGILADMEEIQRSIYFTGGKIINGRGGENINNSY